MYRKCVYAGSFDPPTKGHEKVVYDSLEIFDEVVVAVLENTGKNCLFTPEERVSLLKKLFEGDARVRVLAFGGAAVDLLERENTRFYVRGVRDTLDFERERRDFLASKQLKGDMITVYIPADKDYDFVSSTLVRNSVRFKKAFDGYIPEKIIKDIHSLLEDKNV